MPARNTTRIWELLTATIPSARSVAGWKGVGISSMAIATLLATTAAKAGQLNQWRYDETTQQVELTISEETTPRHFLMAQPARIVVDLPNTQVGDVPVEQMLSGAVRSVRVSQFQPDMARVVIELSPDAVLASGQVEIQQTADAQWVIRPLLAGTPSASVAIALRSEPVPPTTTVQSASVPATQAESAPMPTAATEASVDAETDTLPPLEPGAIELSVVPPALAENEPVAELEEQEDDTADLTNLDVPSIRDAIAEMGADDTQTIVPFESDDGAIALDPQSDTLSIEITDATITQPDYHFDPTAPVLDATVPTRPAQPVLDATHPSVVFPAATSPQAALAQLNTLADQEASALPVVQNAPQAAISVSRPEESSEISAEPPVEPVETDAIALSTSTTAPDFHNRPQTPSTASIAFGQPITDNSAQASQTHDGQISSSTGMTVSLRYPGEEPLALRPGIRQDVLLLQQPLRDGQGKVIAEAGSPVIGRFETSDRGSKFVIQAIATQTENIRVTGESQPIHINHDDETVSEASENSSAFNPASLFGGVASSTVAQIQPAYVVIQPGQIITVQLTDDLALR